VALSFLETARCSGNERQIAADGSKRAVNRAQGSHRTIRTGGAILVPAPARAVARGAARHVVVDPHHTICEALELFDVRSAGSAAVVAALLTSGLGICHLPVLRGGGYELSVPHEDRYLLARRDSVLRMASAVAVVDDATACVYMTPGSPTDTC
jgi:hypothetical protein